MDFRTSET